MSFPSVDEFRTRLLGGAAEQLIDEYIFGGDTYVFRNDAAAMSNLRTHLAGNLDIGSPEDIVVIGSGKVGFSLDPDRFGAPFSEDSDVDVLIVDAELFDRIWFTLLAWHYPRRTSSLGGVDGEWARLRRKELYWGWFEPEKLKFEGLSLPKALTPVRDMSSTWFNAFRSLSLFSSFATRGYSGRLYRTWDHARMYQRDSLTRTRSSVGG